MAVSAAQAQSGLDQVATSISSRTLRRLQWALLAAAPPLFSVLALLLGKKTGWDFYNYHWYNPFALLNGRLGFDVAVGHPATYYNPVADLPLYWFASHGPAWITGLFLGALVGVAIALLGVLSYCTLPVKNAFTRTCAATGVALLGAFGAGAFQEIGDPANDVTAAIGIFAALILIVRGATQPPNTHSDIHLALNAVNARMLLGAGAMAGVAIALKLTTAVYSLGIAVALLFLNRSTLVTSRSVGTALMGKLAPPALFSVGALIGLALIGGFWMLTMWRYSGNPFFPYFNDILQSPLLANASYRDLNFRPKDALAALSLPFRFTADSRVVSESVFRDPHILILYVLLPLVLVIRQLVRTEKKLAIAATSKFLFIFAAIAYVAWMSVFGIYRYLIPLEMLSPLLIALAIAALPINNFARVAMTIAILAAAQWSVRVDLSDRQSWTGRYVEVSVPRLAASENTMILMTGYAPMSYVIPFFPAEIPFLRIDGWLVTGSDRDTGLARTMRERVANHEGPLLALFDETELKAAIAATQSYDLQLVDTEGERCHTVSSNIDKPLKLCEVLRR